MFFSSGRVDTSSIVPSSKMTLKLTCLQACGNDVEKAQKLYDYLAKDVELPDVDIVPPTTLENVKSMAGGLYNWVKENGGDLVQTYQFIKSLKK